MQQDPHAWEVLEYQEMKSIQIELYLDWTRASSVRDRDIEIFRGPVPPKMEMTGVGVVAARIEIGSDAVPVVCNSFQSYDRFTERIGLAPFGTCVIVCQCNLTWPQLRKDKENMNVCPPVRRSSNWPRKEPIYKNYEMLTALRMCIDSDSARIRLFRNNQKFKTSSPSIELDTSVHWGMFLIFVWKTEDT